MTGACQQCKWILLIVAGVIGPWCSLVCHLNEVVEVRVDWIYGQLMGNLLPLSNGWILSGSFSETQTKVCCLTMPASWLLTHCLLHSYPDEGTMHYTTSFKHMILLSGIIQDSRLDATELLTFDLLWKWQEELGILQCPLKLSFSTYQHPHLEVPLNMTFNSYSFICSPDPLCKS